MVFLSSPPTTLKTNIKGLLTVKKPTLIRTASHSSLPTSTTPYTHLTTSNSLHKPVDLADFSDLAFKPTSLTAVTPIAASDSLLLEAYTTDHEVGLDIDGIR